ncbi:hypothetical protein V2J09_010474 [Rumex salicifolius]
MDLSTMKLVIEKGPREGEALEYNSKQGFTICIGRVQRGNTLAIKENGISSKHLSIECSSHDKWVVKDLDSSNGTFLNSSPLTPLTGYDLRDGDVLKIGEVTSIRIRISHITDSQPVGRNLRSRARVLGTGNSEGVQKVLYEGSRRGRGHGRGRGRGRGRGGVCAGDEGLEIDVPDSFASVKLEENKEGSTSEEENGIGIGIGLGKGDAKSGDEGLGLETNTETNVTEVGIRRGRSQGKGKTVLQKPKTNSHISEKDGGSECKAEQPISLRRSTRSRGLKNIDNSAFTSALERIPESSHLVVSQLEVLENVAPTGKRITRSTRGKKIEEVEKKSAQSVTVGDKGREEEHNEEEQIPTESMPNIAEEEEQLAIEMITEQENCNEMEVAAVKLEPQSNVDGIISKGEHSSKESMSEIARKDGDLACQVNFERVTGDELEASMNETDKREEECDTGGVNLQESTAASCAAKDKEVEIAPDLSKMTVGEWLDHLERVLPKQIRAETDQIIQEMQRRSQQFHEFMAQQQKDIGKLPLG